MTEVLLDTAEEHFLTNNYEEAYEKAKLARILDPFFPSVESYEATYRVHVAALRSRRANPFGEPDWYEVLGGIERTSSTEAITHRFCRMGKQIDPKNHCSAAAEGAYSLAARAFEILGDYKSRSAFHYRMNWVPPPMEKKIDVGVIPETIRKSTKKTQAHNNEAGVSSNSRSCANVMRESRQPSSRSHPYHHHRTGIRRMVA